MRIRFFFCNFQMKKTYLGNYNIKTIKCFKVLRYISRKVRILNCIKEYIQSMKSQSFLQAGLGQHFSNCGEKIEKYKCCG